MKNMDNFHYACRGSHHVQPPNWHFSLSAKMNGTQRRILVSEECIVRTAVCQKAHLGLKRRRTVYNQAYSISCYWVMLDWSQSVSQKKISLYIKKISLYKIVLKFCGNFLKKIQVDLKACLGLVLSNRYFPIVFWKIWGWFLGSLILWAIPTP